jgi:hypothetical protein
LTTKKQVRQLAVRAGAENIEALHETCLSILAEKLRHYIDGTLTDAIGTEIDARFDAMEAQFVRAIAIRDGISVEELKARAEEGEYDDRRDDEWLWSLARRWSPRMQITAEELHAKFLELDAKERAEREAQNGRSR